MCVYFIHKTMSLYFGFGYIYKSSRLISNLFATRVDGGFNALLSCEQENWIVRQSDVLNDKS